MTMSPYEFGEYAAGAGVGIGSALGAAWATLKRLGQRKDQRRAEFSWSEEAKRLWQAQRELHEQTRRALDDCERRCRDCEAKHEQGQKANDALSERVGLLEGMLRDLNVRPPARRRK